MTYRDEVSRLAKQAQQAQRERAVARSEQELAQDFARSSMPEIRELAESGHTVASFNMDFHGSILIDKNHPDPGLVAAKDRNVHRAEQAASAFRDMGFDAEVLVVKKEEGHYRNGPLSGGTFAYDGTRYNARVVVRWE